MSLLTFDAVLHRPSLDNVRLTNSSNNTHKYGSVVSLHFLHNRHSRAKIMRTVNKSVFGDHYACLLKTIVEYASSAMQNCASHKSSEASITSM
jgi:hypothetical protein